MKKEIRVIKDINIIKKKGIYREYLFLVGALESFLRKENCIGVFVNEEIKELPRGVKVTDLHCLMNAVANELITTGELVFYGFWTWGNKEDGVNERFKLFVKQRLCKKPAKFKASVLNLLTDY